MIEKYFAEIEKAISYFKEIRTYNLRKKIYNNRQGFIGGIITFEDESQLDFIEVKNTDIKQKVKYRYHYMNKEKIIIFRYDNATHHKNIKTYPHHKHLKDSVIESYEMNLFDILLDIASMIQNKKT